MLYIAENTSILLRVVVDSPRKYQFNEVILRIGGRVCDNAVQNQAFGPKREKGNAQFHWAHLDLNPIRRLETKNTKSLCRSQQNKLRKFMLRASGGICDTVAQIQASGPKR